MAFNKPIITTAGINASTGAFFGNGRIVIDGVQIGSGTNATPAAATALANKVLDAKIISYKKNQSNIELVFSFDNSDLDAGFNWTEYGIMATYIDNNDNESQILYCYGSDTSESPQSIPQFTGANSYVKNKFNITVAVRNSENVTVDLNEFSDFVITEDFEDHLADDQNPHSVTKEQVGLGNVDNTSDSGAMPQFTEAATLQNITSGETAAVLWGKVKKAISSLISHIAASNPHNITISKIGAAASLHSHSTSDITSGMLPISRGGTGANSAYQARANLELSNLGRLVEDWNAGETSVSANKYRSIRTLNLPKGVWVVTFRINVSNWAQLGNVEVFITDRTYNNVTSFDGAHPAYMTEITLDSQDSFKTAMVTFIYRSEGTNQYITVNPSKNASLGCMWRAVGII